MSKMLRIRIGFAHRKYCQAGKSTAPKSRLYSRLLAVVALLAAMRSPLYALKW